jgi:hypothetical protein
VLIILHCTPVATPLETVLDKEAIAEVVLRNLILEFLTAVHIGLASGWLDK